MGFDQFEERCDLPEAWTFRDLSGRSIPLDVSRVLELREMDVSEVYLLRFRIVSPKRYIGFRFDSSVFQSQENEATMPFTQTIEYPIDSRTQQDSLRVAR